MTYTILTAEDDEDIVKLLRLYLESSGYRVLTAGNGLEALALIDSEPIHLAVLDIMMPHLDGFELTRKIREHHNIPIIILSAKSEISDKILGLNLGADDYIAKPFNPLEIIARVQANLRRFYNLSGAHPQMSSERLVIGALALDTESIKLYKGGEDIPLTPNEYKILALLMRAPGRVFTKSQICEAVNGEFYENYENAITVHISHLRDKIESDPRSPAYIKNIRGLGYKIEKQEK